MSIDAPVMTPYRQGRAGRRFRPLLLAGLGLYAALNGAAIAILPPEFLFILGVPLAIAAGVILWLLPDGDWIPEATLATLLVSFISWNCLWPNYISVDLPGLPWINPPRIVIGLLLLIGLYTFATSARLRGEVAATLGAIPHLRAMFWIFWGMSVLTIPLSALPVFSLNKWFNNQIYWTFLFCTSAWLSTKPRVVPRIAIALVWSGIAVSLLALWETKIRALPWIGNIPSFLTVDPLYLSRILSEQARAGTGIYRAHATFSTSLVFAEYLSLIYPFILHATVRAAGFWRKALLILGLIAVLAAMFFTNARSGIIGFIMSVFLYGAFAAYRQWKRDKASLIGVSLFAMMPLAAAVLLALMITWPRLHNMTFGGGQHQASTESRSVQWGMGMPRVYANPVGHGPGRAAGTLGFANLNGQVTIDSYYLTVLLEYGFIGLASFLVLFGGQAVYGLRTWLDAEDGDELWVGPATIALMNYLVIKAVLSSEFNTPIAFILLGMVFGLFVRQQARLGHAMPALRRGRGGFALPAPAR